MRKLLISAAIAAATLATPAMAQYGPYGAYRGYVPAERAIQVQIDQIVRQIRVADNRDRISEREARRLMDRARFVDRRFDRFRRNGLTPWERRTIRQDLRELRRQLRADRIDGRWDDNYWDHGVRWDDDDRRDRRDRRD